MGDTSIIARRLSDRYIQFGWAGNGGYYATVGACLMEFYNTPEMVEYLFSLGQLRHLWLPHSEKSDFWYRTIPDGMPHWVADSEDGMFCRLIADFFYFFDADNRWYYVCHGTPKIKIPLSLVAENLDEKGDEFTFTWQVRLAVTRQLLAVCRDDPAFREKLQDTQYTPERINALADELAQTPWTPPWETPLDHLWKHHRPLLNCFDDWALAQPDETGKNIGKIITRPRGDAHIETIFWPEAGG